MNKFVRIFLGVCMSCVCFVSHVQGQGQNIPYDPSVFIKVDINSGNPAFPYPQFKEYKVGKTLAKYNAEGVTHADMEKTGREAYEIMSHRCRYSKTSQGGVKYISFNDPTVPASTHAPHCSEGDGYMLLMSAIFADQPTFNGLWMWIHDYKIPKVERYFNGETFLPNYEFSPGLPLCYTDETKIDPNEGSATDGDDDIALAVLIAYKQWGEWMMQDGKPVLDSKGNPISYKKIAQDFLAAYVDTFMITSVNGDGSIYKGGHTSGDIGIDGYVHGGNKGGDMTQWRQTQKDYPFVTPNCNLSTPDAYADYIAPAYYNEFAKFLEEEGEGTEWQINQYKRGEASSDWLIGQAYKKGMIASAGKFSFEYGDDANVSFTQFSEGEDFRFVLRTLINYMWHGNPETTWDPVAHQPKAGGNTFEKDMADRMAEFLKEPWSGYGNKAPGDLHGQCVQMGAAPDPGQPYWKGVCNIMQSYNADKTPMGSGASPAPYTLGASAAAAVCSGDLELVADMYRQSEITWDGTNKACTWDSEERYLGNTPEYFHGFYRCWGLLTHSGNLHAPQDMKREANVKVYMSVDKTYAYVDDLLEYNVQFRNYGSADAKDVKIVTELDPNYEVVSIKRGKGSVEGGKITWNVGEIPGFKTGGLDATIDSVTFIVAVKDTLNPRICLTSTVSGSNFEDWTSNEYPNHATYTMERNCVDIVPNRTLQMTKKASRKILNPNDAVTFTVSFENKSLGEASWLNGGRNHVRLSYANYISGTEMFQGYRFWNDAYEAYINPGNYRVSYFMYDAAAMGLASANNPTGWDFTLNNANDCYKYLLNHTPDTISFHYQRVPSGEDEHGKWNQRLMVQFADFTMAPSSYTFNKIAERPENPNAVPGANNFYSLHKGVGGPTFIRTQLRSNPHLAMAGKVKDDWSYEKLETKERPMDMQTSALYLLTPCYADVNNLGYEVDVHARNVCYTGDIDMTTYDRMLVEEFDGYTWRRILGRAPLPGRECMNVTIIDTIPYELEFHHWVDSTALKNDKGEKIQATYTPAPAGTKAFSGIIKWTAPSMLVGEKDKLVYVCVARDMGCPDIDDVYYSNVAWISSDTDSPDSSRVDLMTTCAEIPPVGDEQESLFKRASKKAAQQGETVDYTVKYINNTGTHVEADCKSTKGWKALGNSTLPSIDGGYLLLNTEGSHLFAPEYSYGNNGDVYFQLDRCTNAIENTWVVLRWTGGTPGSADFKGAAVKVTPHASLPNTFKCEVYDNGKCIAKEGEGEDLIIYPGDGANPEFKFSIIDNHLYMYINNAEEEWVDVMKDWKDLAAKGPGYFGMYVKGKTNSAPHLTEFITDLDYAFNVTLSDQLPEELGNLTAISDNGKWDETPNYISWPMVATTVETAIPPMDSVVRTYTAEVVACVDKYITNMGIATVYGLDSMKVLNTIECGSSCNLESVDLLLEDTQICEGDSALLEVVAKESGSYYYTYYLNGEIYKKNQTKAKLYLTEPGEYYVVVTGVSDETCTLKSDKVTLKVNKRPVSADFDAGVLCQGTLAANNKKYGEASKAVNYGISLGYSIEWYDAEGEILSDITTLPNPDDAEAGEYKYVYRYKSEEGCYSDSATFTFTKADTAVIKLSDLTICAGQSATLTVEENDTYTYLWSDGSTQNELVTDKAGNYSVEVTTAEGCVANARATVTVADELVVDLGQDTTICSANLPLVLDATTNYDTYEWNDGSSESTLEVTESGEYEVKVTQGTCEGSGKINVVVSPTPVLNGTFKVSYLVSDTTSAGVFDKSLTEYDKNVLEKESGLTYTWYDEKMKELSSEPIPAIPSEGNAEYIYYVKAVNDDGCESELQEIKVMVISSPMPSAEDVNYCVNDDAEPLTATATDNESATTWTLTWYDAEGNKLADAPKPSTVEAGKTVYYVSQTDQDGVEGAKKSVTVTVYALPELKPIMPLKRSCDEPILLNSLFEEQTGVEKFYFTFFDPNGEDMTAQVNCIDCEEDVYAPTSGTYRALASYRPVSGLSCSSEKSSIEIVIDKIEDLTISGSPSICPYEEIVLTASATSEGSELKYLWRGDASSNEAEVSMTDRDGTYGKVYSFSLNVSAGACEVDTVMNVTVGRGQLTGAILANGEKTKDYLSCGNESVKLSTTHEGTDFVWKNYDGELIGEGKSVEVNPEATTTYIVSFTNKCETSDTIEVKIMPITVEPEFQLLNVEICEGESASAKLKLKGYDPTMAGSYIKWYKDGEQMSDFDNKTELTILSATLADAGEYTFEVSNGLCLAENLGDVTSATLVVKQYVSFSQTESVVALRGDDVDLSLNQLKPADATVTWKGAAHTGEGNPYTLSSITADELFKVHVEADNYCARDTQLQVLVDAKVVVSAATSTSVICLGDEAVVVADTTGTGKLLHPSNYKITWYACDASGDCKALSASGLTLKDKAANTASYYVEVTYGDQEVQSEKIPVSVILPPTYTTTTGAVSCSGEEVEITIEVKEITDYEIAWANGEKGASIQVSPANTTTYSFTITQQGICPVTDKVEVRVKEQPAITLAANTTVCSGDGVEFKPEVTGDDIISYQWKDPNGNVVARTKNLSLQTAVAGSYTLTVASESCGEATASQEVTVRSLPEVTVDSVNISTRTIVSAEAVEYRVDKGEWSTEDTYEGLVYDLPHTAFARDEYGCVGMTVFVVASPPIAIPEYFTPDGSGQHDTWDVSTILDSYPNSKVTIYDRYGKVVAELEGDTSEWDGTYNGNPLPSTDYWYIIYVPEIDRVFKGHFTLIRTK